MNQYRIVEKLGKLRSCFPQFVFVIICYPRFGCSYCMYPHLTDRLVSLCWTNTMVSYPDTGTIWNSNYVLDGCLKHKNIAAVTKCAFIICIMKMNFTIKKPSTTYSYLQRFWTYNLKAKNHLRDTRERSVSIQSIQLFFCPIFHFLEFHLMSPSRDERGRPSNLTLFLPDLSSAIFMPLP